jgi:hypothetical protein
MLRRVGLALLFVAVLALILAVTILTTPATLGDVLGSVP